MKFCTAILAVVASVATSRVNAFTPNGKDFSQAPSGLMIPKQLQNKDGSLWTPNMVAGGAERSVGQEYYEGAWRSVAYRICGLYLSDWIELIECLDGISITTIVAFFTGWRHRVAN